MEKLEKSEIWYQVDWLISFSIKPVEVVEVSDWSVLAISDGEYGKQQEYIRRKDLWSGCFPTQTEALDFAQNKIQNEYIGAKQTFEKWQAKKLQIRDLIKKQNS